MAVEFAEVSFRVSRFSYPSPTVLLSSSGLFLIDSIFVRALVLVYIHVSYVKSTAPAHLA